MSIAHSVLKIQDRITQAALRSGRKPEDIRLVAVSKTIAAEKIQEAIGAGVAICGENYIQEARTKIEQIGRTIAWHYIGHLQSNKAKYAVQLFDMIHSVDSISLAAALNKEAKKANKVLPVLIQVNISGENTKSGIEREQAAHLLKSIALLNNLSVQGLMTMPPWFDNPEDARPYFSALRKLRDELAGEKIPGVSLTELSMGMSADFEVAIEEGATLVRIGTAIFGERG